MAKKNWIKNATKNHGGLHRATGIPAGQTIPEKKVQKAERSSSPKVRKEAQLAEELKGFNKKKR